MRVTVYLLLPMNSEKSGEWVRMIEVHDISKILQPTIVLASAACMLKFKPIILQ